MRTLLLSLTALGGLTLAGLATASAAPVPPHGGIAAPATVHAVQYYYESPHYYEGPRRWHRWHRWHEAHEWHRWHRGY